MSLVDVNNERISSIAFRAGLLVPRGTLREQEYCTHISGETNGSFAYWLHSQSTVLHPLSRGRTIFTMTTICVCLYLSLKLWKERGSIYINDENITQMRKENIMVLACAGRVKSSVWRCGNTALATFMLLGLSPAVMDVRKFWCRFDEVVVLNG